MTFAELISTAKSRGYTKVNVGNQLLDVDDFAYKYADDKDYTLRDDGTVSYFENDMDWFSNTKFRRFYIIDPQ